MEAHVTFLSSSFPPAEGEDAELINEGTYGKKLVEWLRLGLPGEGVEPGEVIVEDWGWLLFLKKEGVRAFIGCSTPFEAGQKEQDCHCTISVSVPLLQRLFGSDAAANYLKQVKSALERLIASHPDIHRPEWSEK
jgi:hypothetical protein